MLSFSTSSLTLAVTTLALLQHAPTSVSAASLRRLEAMEFQAIMSQPGPSCIIENGYDYVGNDIGNALGPVESCCDKCSQVNDCKAWSWTNQSGGTCYFKSKQGQIVVNANVKSALYFRGNAAYCQLQQNIDYVGNDIANKQSGSADGCCSICQNTIGCRAYTWTDHNGGTCWLKSDGGSKVYKAGAKSAIAYPVWDGSGTCPTPVSGVDYVGNDIGNKPSTTPEGCCDVCKQFPNCRAYSWTNQNSGTCWLKSAKTTVVNSGSVWSAQVYDNLPPTCSGPEYDVDYIGNDIGNAQTGDWTQCCSLCAGKSGCKAWTWSDYNGGTCWFKSAKGQTTSKPGAKSAVLN